MSELKRITKKAIGCFMFDIKDHEHVTGEFGTYEAFFNYHMAVKRLGEYEDSGLSPEEIKERTCNWEENADGIWSCSNCTIAWSFNDQGPKENSVNYCPKCGRKIVKICCYEEEIDEA